MKMTLYRLSLPLLHEFRISRESITTQNSLVLKLEHDGVAGYGEVTENRFYGHEFDSIIASLQKTKTLLPAYADPDRSPLDLWPELMSAVEGDTFAAAALDMAAHDLRGRRLGIATWNDWGLDWTDVPDSSFTIGIDTIDVMVGKLHEMKGWSIYKIKLGTSQDLEIMTELRRHTDARFRVDANCGWTARQTIANSKVLADLGVEFIEQPLPIKATANDKRLLFKKSAIPIIADEDCQIVNDVERCQPFYHGVNVKICKCGGLTPALHMLRQARQLGMQTMVGCMVESSVGISGAAQLLPMLDYADLDGAALLRDEPASGVRINRGRVILPDRPGCGAELNSERLAEFSEPGRGLTP